MYETFFTCLRRCTQRLYVSDICGLIFEIGLSNCMYNSIVNALFGFLKMSHFGVGCAHYLYGLFSMYVAMAFNSF